jgi:hypothetical protein
MRQEPERNGNGEMSRCRIEERRQTSGRNLQGSDQVVGAVLRVFSTSEPEAAK